MGTINLIETIKPILDQSSDFAEVRSAIKQSNVTLNEAYEQGADIASLLLARSDFVDYLLDFYWKHYQLAEHKFACLIAVGGYGRQEMHPASDIDLLILLPEEPDAECQERLSAFVTFLWDIGLDIGHSVRTLSECLEEAKNDLTVITNLIESRVLVGNEVVYQQLKAEIDADKLWNSRDFLAAKIEEQEARYIKYGKTAYRVEPNLKEGPGGLRDIQLIMWVIQRHYGVLSVEELRQHNLLTEEEYDELTVNRDFLWEVRFVLHQLSERKEDRLLFQHQRQLAKSFGFLEENENKAVETFMMQYYRTITSLDRLTNLLLNLLKEKLNPEISSHTQIDTDYEEKNGLIAVRNSQLFEQRPACLLEIFSILQTTRKANGITPDTVRLIRQNLHRIDDDFRNDNAAKQTFIQIMQQQKGVTLALRQMNRYGVLAAYIPAFQGIVGLMQFDLYHAFTVDDHTLHVIRNVRRYSTEKGRKELPFCSDVFNDLANPKLLYLAALFHDIAKGRGGDHAKIGAIDAYEFCRSHHLTGQEASIVSWLVEKHLMMSIIVQKKDISDPDVVREFSEMMGSSERLSYLYLLTIADIRGTNMKLWTSWKDSLLKQLYLASMSYLKTEANHSSKRKTHKQRQNEKRDAALSLLVASSFTEVECLKLWENLGSHYFLQYDVKTIVWHATNLLSGQDTPIVRLRANSKESTTLFIYQKDDPQLFIRIVASLEQLNINTVEAKITSSRDGYDLYTLHILNAEGEVISQPDDQDNVMKRIHDNLSSESIPDTSAQRMPRELKHLDVPTTVEFGQNAKKGWTILEIETGDRPGLLSSIGKALYQEGIQIHDARISTLEEQAQDVFQITDLDNKAIIDSAKQEAIKTAIEQLL